MKDFTCNLSLRKYRNASFFSSLPLEDVAEQMGREQIDS